MDDRTPLRFTRMLVIAVALACAAGVVVTSPTMTVAASGILAVLAVLVARNGRRHARVARALTPGSRPGTIGGVAVRWRPLSSHAGVAGLRRPTIFCDPSLVGWLSFEELRAVVLHERGHQQRRDPLRLVVLASLGPGLRWLPGGLAWLEHRRADLEIRADRDALQEGVPRRVLAGALLKLGDSEPAHATAGFSSAVELRLQALIDPGVAPPPSSRWWGVVAVAMVVFGVCAVAAAHHWLMPAGALGCVLAGC
jgi:beta-lactamase regulating signal transducer with metallopeptidase domain